MKYLKVLAAVILTAVTIGAAQAQEHPRHRHHYHHRVVRHHHHIQHHR